MVDSARALLPHEVDELGEDLAAVAAAIGLPMNRLARRSRGYPVGATFGVSSTISHAPRHRARESAGGATRPDVGRRGASRRPPLGPLQEPLRRRWASSSESHAPSVT